MRQVVLDTETTGLDPQQGHRIIEIGCVELVNRRLTGNNYHQYLQPDREIDPGAIEVHGITNEALADKPRFHEIADEFLEYVRDAELVIHNAPFDVGFINAELSRLEAGKGRVKDHCKILDTLAMARNKHPGQKNTLDALCKRYEVDNSNRTLHGALLDAEILADVYLIMTGGQAALSLGGMHDETGMPQGQPIRRAKADRAPLRVVQPSAAEREEHEAYLETLRKASGGKCVWTGES